MACRWSGFRSEPGPVARNALRLGCRRWPGDTGDGRDLDRLMARKGNGLDVTVRLPMVQRAFRIDWAVCKSSVSF